MHILQAVRWTDATRAGTIAAGHLSIEDGLLRGIAGQYISFDGLFGAFFDGYWLRYTAVRTFALQLTLSGCVDILIDRVDSAAGTREPVVRSRQRESGGWIVVPIPPSAGGQTRLVLTIELIEDSVISIDWVTDVPPVRVVELAGVICTFNRDADVSATLDELLSEPDGLMRVIVVNQGQPELVDRLVSLQAAVDAGRLTVIDQANLGGAGGFGRGMLEALDDDRCSHVLLMDDDIEIDRAVVTRLIAALSYVHDDLALGGAMLDRESPIKLFSVGDVLHPRKPEIRNLVDPDAADITTEAASRYLALHHQPDFNGWWFFACSKKAIARFGLPLPLFIRGDDVEYGCRLTWARVRTLAWPGLAVWHAPFHAKRHPWHYFYDRRNSLYLCEMHDRLGRLRLSHALILGFLNHLLRFDYQRATCIVLGLQAFNDGATRLSQWSGADHARLVAEFGSAEVPIVEAPETSFSPKSALPALLLFGVRLIKDLTTSSPQPNEPVVLRQQDWRPVIRNRPRHVRIFYPETGTVARFSHDPRRTRECARQFAKELLRFQFRRWRPDRLKALTGPDFWSIYTARETALPLTRRRS